METKHSNPEPKALVPSFGKFGHTALICFHDINLNYQPQPSPQSFNTVLMPNSQLFNPLEFSYPTMANHAVTPTTIVDTNWNMDLGVTHHFVLNINMLESVIPFTGSDQVIVGNNKKISISYLVTATLPSSYAPLILHHVYHTPKISNNLISVTKLCSNKCFFFNLISPIFLSKIRFQRVLL